MATIPADPDNLNDDRAEWAAAALDTFRERCYQLPEEPITVLGDLLCDLMHWCDRNEVSFAEALENAQGNYADETRELDEDQPQE
jgi:hypothetical protein